LVVIIIDEKEMCYDKSYLTKRLEKYAKRYGDSPEEVKALQEQLKKIGLGPRYHATGFDHPFVPVITNESNDIFLYSWGLIPYWAKSPAEAVKISNSTINARVETIFSKPAFREPARSKRCLVMIDGFFEHHHKNGKTFPYHIRFKDNEPMTLAGLWDEWRDPASGLTRRTYTVVTTKANPMMARIHNNPNASEGPRMPLILAKEFEHDWLNPINSKEDEELIKEISKPYDQETLESFTVRRLRGKEAVGNIEKAIEPYRYIELEESQGSLF
jgi:putative SOS response-associated peptidase YedK